MKMLPMLAALGLAMPTHADVTLNGVFTDHMVLQRDMPVSVYGMAEPGEKVVVAFAGQQKSATADKDHQWRVKLDAMNACTNPAAMTVTGKSKVVISDIVVGDVWVCSGQSNMELLLGNCGTPDDVRDANFPLLRQFAVSYCLTEKPQDSAKGSWVVCTPQTARGFSATGFYFGRRVHQDTGIPIGLIKSVASGTPIQAFCSPEGLASVPELAEQKARLDKEILEYRNNVSNLFPRLEGYLVGVRKALAGNLDLPEPVPIPAHPSVANRPCGWHCIYNGMIHPLTTFGIKGAIWYQGETNDSEEDGYYHKMRALIGGWRKAWNQPPAPGSGAPWDDFPVYFVQLPNYGNPTGSPEGGDGWARTRMGQLKALAIPKTGMAVAIELADPGNPGNVHPGNKRDVGERLALWALAKDYGKKDRVCSGPLYRAMRVEGDKIRITFDCVGSGLAVAAKKGYTPVVKDTGGKLQKFAIAGEDRKWVWAEAVIDGGTVLVSSPSVPKPVAVRYAYSANPDGCNLYNNEGLPASPFRTDSWQVNPGE